MDITFDKLAIPQQGIEARAQLVDRAISEFVMATRSSELTDVKRRIVVVRSRLSRYKNFFNGGVVAEADYFDQLKASEAELVDVLACLGRVRARLGNGPAVARLERQISDALSDVQSARTYKVLISYRRDDAAYIADRLALHLEERLGADAVFRDTSSIEPGDDFARRINDALAETRVCLALIGQRWRGEQADGTSRINLPDDFVRHEVGTALARRITVVPVLTENVRVEELADLPPDLEALRRRNAMPLRPEPDFSTDAERITNFLIQRLV